MAEGPLEDAVSISGDAWARGLPNNDSLQPITFVGG
jgi:hypothetical protein